VRAAGGAVVSAGLRRAWLSLAVHADAFRFDPAGYAQALLWRLRGLRLRSRNRLAALIGRSPRAYALWIESVEPNIRDDLVASPTAPVPIVVPVVDCQSGDAGLDETMRSIAGNSTASLPVLVGNGNGSARLERPAELIELVSASGTWLCFLRAGDTLAPSAIEIYARAAARADDSWIIYADDDLTDGGERYAPHFKSAWNPELFEHHDFITGAAIVRVTPEMLSDLEPRCWIEQLTCRAIERGPPVHLAAVLHHRRRRPEPRIPAKPTPVRPNPAPLVSVIVPTRNRLSYLQACVDGVRRTAYPAIELIVIDNESDEADVLRYFEELRSDGIRVLPVGGAFNFSALNNAAVKHATGELLCFLNNDIEIRDPDWLSLLTRQAVRPELGAVGARLLYPDGTLQHAGVVTGVGGGAAHAHRFLRQDEAGYFLRDRLPQRVSAVTAACLVVGKEKFLAAGGFNEVDFPVAFNDVDLCLKLNGKGWQSFYEPRATLIHHESKSRGSDSSRENRARFAGELEALKRHWGTDRERDPFHHPHLSPFCEQFHIAV
jgi:GT2 family glycosyltransferase